MAWHLVVLYLIGGFVCLDKGADWLVRGGSRLALRMGMSAMVIGMTVVAWGTSLPEVVVSGISAQKGHGSMALGTVVGSNVANIGLVLGVSAMILPTLLRSGVNLIEGAWLLGSLGLLWYCLVDFELSRGDAGLMLAVFAAYTAQMWFSVREAPQPDPVGERESHPVVHVVFGAIGIALGAWLVTEGGAAGARKLGMDERVIAITLFALGTSLPELTTSVRGALRGESQIALGNVVGSNVFNSLAVLGIVCLIQPLDANTDETSYASFEKVLELDLPVALAFSIALIVFPRLPGARRLASILIVGYLTYTWWLYATGTV